MVIVTGLSGGGKTVTLRTLEDIGFFCIDNLPPSLLLDFLRAIERYGTYEKVAVGVDVRGFSLNERIEDNLKVVKERYNSEVLFLQADEESILRRYKETRRPHPLSSKFRDLVEAVRNEQLMIMPLREFADRVIDTTNLNPHELRALIREIYQGESRYPSVTVMSFSFKRGLPANADLVFDVRYLPNPYFVPELRELSGLHSPVREYVLNSEETAEFLRRLKDFLDYALPKYRVEGRAYLTIAIGCTGGMHRSVVVAEEIAQHLREQSFEVIVVHRDL